MSPWQSQKYLKRLQGIFKHPENSELGRQTQLKDLAKEIGISLAGTQLPNTKALDEEEVVRRIHETLRSWRESGLWRVAVISAIASVFSALAAWLAVLKK
jgi:hypothetical protein